MIVQSSTDEPAYMSIVLPM